MKLDLGNRNSTVVIVLGLDLFFFSIAIILSFFPHTKDIAGKVWEVFIGANGSLFLALKTDSTPKPDNPTQPAPIAPESQPKK